MTSVRTTTTLRAGFAIAMAIAFSVLFMVSVPSASAQSTDDGAEIYNQQCAQCHGTTGLGIEGVFPPLAGNPDAGDHDYVVDVVTNGLEGKVIMGVTYSAKMPAFGDRLSAQEIQDVSAYVVELSGSDTSTPTTPPPTGEGAAAIGENLFRGSTLMSNGGVACIACHTAGIYNGLGGPTMAFSLNGVIDVYGAEGFAAVVTNPAVAPMIAVFEDHPVTDQEAADLAAYLETTTADDEGGPPVDILLELGIVGFLALILVTALIIRGPQKSYVKKLRSSR